jgi:hypothetical protein
LLRRCGLVAARGDSLELASHFQEIYEDVPQTFRGSDLAKIEDSIRHLTGRVFSIGILLCQIHQAAFGA